MFLQIDLNSSVPLYLQLKRKIIEGIATGQLREGDSLPSVRSLASDLGINLHTVKKTYDLLKNEGFVHIHRQKGVVVSAQHTYVATDEMYHWFKEQFTPVLYGAVGRGLKKDEIKKMVLEMLQDLKGEI